MRALLIALLLAVMTAVPAFADDDSGSLRPVAPGIELGAPTGY